MNKEDQEKVLSLLYDCMQDIFSTARTNQGNINGIELNNPQDAPVLSRVGKHFVNQRGVDESLAVLERCKAVLSKIT